MTQELSQPDSMARRRRRWGLHLLIAGIVFAVLLGAAVPLVSFITVFYRTSVEMRERKRVVLYQTNHAALLAACVDLWNKRLSLHADRASATSQPVDFDIDPSDPAVPPIIRSLNPNGVNIHEGSVHIELGGGFDHFGVEAFVNGAPAPSIGETQLIPGLWFYAESEVPGPAKP
jgi:hypothetical protein